MTRMLLFLATAAAFAQTSPKLEFEAVSVKQIALPNDGRFAFGCRSDPVQYVCDYTTLNSVIWQAYAVPPGSKVSGPDWINTEPYRIAAKSATRMAKGDLAAMLRQLLATRFALKLHTEERPAPVFALVVAAKGLKLTPVTFTGDDPSTRSIHPLPNGVELKHVSMARLADFLSGWANVGRHVVDETGIKDLFDINLTYATKGGAADLNPPPDSDFPTVFEALQRVGLRLESRRGTVTDYIIDHIDRVPTEN